MKKKKRKKLFYCKSGLMLEKNAQQCCGIFTVGHSQKPSGQGLGNML